MNNNSMNNKSMKVIDKSILVKDETRKKKQVYIWGNELGSSPIKKSNTDKVTKKNNFDSKWCAVSKSYKESLK